MPDDFHLSEHHVALLRKMVISWDIAEAGAPTVEPAAPYGSTELLDDVASVLGLTAGDDG